MLIAALVARPKDREAVRRAFVQVARVRFCAKCEDLARVLSMQWVGGVVVEPSAEDGHVAPLLVRELKRRYPGLPLLMYCDLSLSSVRAIPDLTRAGIDHLLLSGDSPLRLSEFLALGSTGVTTDELLRLLGVGLPLVAREVLTLCVDCPRSNVSVDTVARNLGISRRTLRNRLRAASFMDAGELTGWGRLLAAGRLLDWEGSRSLDAVAFGAGFDSSDALRAMFRRYVGIGPAQARRQGAVALVCDCLRRRILEGHDHVRPDEASPDARRVAFGARA